MVGDEVYFCHCAAKKRSCSLTNVEMRLSPIGFVRCDRRTQSRQRDGFSSLSASQSQICLRQAIQGNKKIATEPYTHTVREQFLQLTQ